MPKCDIKKVLILGSGALKIGEAGEFDYSGSQAIKALKEEGIFIVLVNPNIATIQTSEHMADRVYFLPIEPFFIEKVIEREKPEGILVGFGGQSALNCAVSLHKKGVFKQYDVCVLGTQIRAIEETEDRGLFVEKLKEINIKTPRSMAVSSVEETLEAVKELKYPVMIRVAYALGGRGSGIIKNEEELRLAVKRAFSFTNQILVEECLIGWKEIEYEVVRDSYDNCITVCNMENFDPMGVHTGESIVVAPSQTLTNKEYHLLRAVSIEVIRHLGVVGECNIQFALKDGDYRVIEVNARLSRSSALASKATGYPLAYVAAKLALGYGLWELQNKITRKTNAFFEPALDYVVVKAPRWDLQKFKNVSQQIGTEMKSIGEVMAIARTFEEALQKALRMLQHGFYGLVCNKKFFELNPFEIEEGLKNPTDKRIFLIAEALKKGFNIEKIYELTKIDQWFLSKIENIVNLEQELKKGALTHVKDTNKIELVKKAKMSGFSDKQLGIIFGCEELTIRELRKGLGILPVVKQIDTLAGEFPAETNYIYLTYNGNENDVKRDEKKKIVVLGAGAYSIGSSVEFDWCCVSAINTLQKLGFSTIAINCNPETVSTDYDCCDCLYFEELSFERVMDILEFEEPFGIVLCAGGQVPNNLALKLSNGGINIVGTGAKSIDCAEDRFKFSKLLDSLGIEQPAWAEFNTVEEVVNFAKKIGYPVLIRPSYVLSGASMNVAFDEGGLVRYLESTMDTHLVGDIGGKIVVSKFINNAREIEIDGVAKDGELLAWVLMEHVENAGVHSGDATIVLPPQRLYLETVRRVEEVTKKIARALKITGPFNIQFIAKDNEVMVIECNLRASRSFPFASKTTKVNLIELAIRAMFQETEKYGWLMNLSYVGVKAPQFSFSRLKGADPVTGVEMASTGEVACFGEDLEEAFLKSLLSVGFNLPKGKILVSISGEENKYKLLDSLRNLERLGFELFATEHTALFLKENGVNNKRLFKIREHEEPNVKSYLINKEIELVINIPDEQEESEDEYIIRRLSVDFNIPLLTNVQLAKLFVEAISKYKIEDLKIKAWDEY